VGQSPGPRVCKAEIGRIPEEGESAERIAPCGPIESDADRSDSVAIARTRHNEGAGDCFAQRRGIPDPAQDVGARRPGPRGAQAVKAGLPRKCVPFSPQQTKRIGGTISDCGWRSIRGQLFTPNMDPEEDRHRDLSTVPEIRQIRHGWSCSPGRTGPAMMRASPTLG